MYTILMITNNYTPYAGGVVSSIQTSAALLRAHGYRVIIVTLSFSETDPQEPDLIRIPAHLYFTYKENPCAVPHNTTLFLDDIIRRYNPAILHTHHPFLLGMSALKLAKKYAIPLVFTHHTQYDQYTHYVPLPKDFTQRVINNRVQTYCKNADVVIVPSTALQKMVSVPTTVIPSCIKEQFIHSHYTQPPLDGPKKLITVSRFMPEKNIPFLLKAYSLLPQNEYHFTLFGFGAELESLKKLAYETHKLSPRSCTFVVRPSNTQLVDAYKNAHLFLFASQTETQGLVLAESLAAGTPIIALDDPVIRNTIIDGYNGFLVGNEYACAQKVRDLLHDSSTYIKMRAHAHQSARAYYPQFHIDALLRCYNFVITKFLNCQGSS